jgi:hypothetical protein
MDRLIQAFQEALNLIREFMKALYEQVKKFLKLLTTCNPKRKTFPRGKPEVIKCIGHQLAGYAFKTRTRIRNSC